MRMIVILVACGAMAACNTRRNRPIEMRDELKSPKVEVNEIPWEELSQAQTNFRRKKASVDANNQVSRLVGAMRSMKRTGSGVSGKVGKHLVFVADWKRLEFSKDRAYWGLVRFLSERYSCLIAEQERVVEGYKFICRDRRLISMRYYYLPLHYVVVGTKYRSREEEQLVAENFD